MDVSVLSNLILNIGRLIGLAGFCLLGLTVFIGGTARFFKRWFKLADYLKFHKRFAITSFSLLVFHPILVTVSFVLLGSSVLDFLISYMSLPEFVMGEIALTIFLTVVITGLLQKKIKRVAWITIHRFTVVALVLAFIHLLYFGSMSGLLTDLPLLKILIGLGALGGATGVTARIILMFTDKKKKGTA